MDEIKKQIVDLFIAEGSYSSEEEVMTAALVALVEKRMKEEEENSSYGNSPDSSDQAEVNDFINSFSRQLQK
jgi:Arc/MetJ-type ribon-helix-helix transcriptional regulator